MRSLAAWRSMLYNGATMRERLGRTDTVALAGYPLVACLFLWPVLFTNAILTGYDTFTIFYPHRIAAARALLSGALPLWNPDHFLGAPLLANPQVAALYPLNWPFLALPAGPSLAYTMALHMVLAACFMYAFARLEAQMSRAGAWLAGLLFAFGGFMGQQTGHLNQVSVAAWLPLLLLLGAALWRRPSWQAFVACALVVCLQFLAGHSQESYMILVTLAAYAAFLSVQQYGVRRLLASWRQNAAVAAAVVLGTVLSAVQLLPTLELSRLSIRGGGLTFRQASSFSLDPRDLALALLPNYHAAPPNEMAGYIGVLALLLAVAGLRCHPNASMRRFLALLSGAALLLALGRYTPVYWAAYYLLPGVELFRVPARWLLLYTFGAVLLAGMGLDVLIYHLRHSSVRPVVHLLAAVIGITGAALIAGARFLHEPSALTMGIWLVLAAGLALAIAARLPLLRPRLFSGIMLLVAVAEIYAAGRFLEYNRYSAPESLSALRPAIAYLQTQDSTARPVRVLSVSDATWDPGDMALIRSEYPALPAGRIQDALDAVKTKELLTANLPTIFGLQTADGYDGGVLPLKRYVQLEGLLLPADQLSPDGRLRDHLKAIPEARLLSLLGVDYAITDKNHDIWIDDVYYDLAFATPVTADLTLAVQQPIVATAVGLVSHIEGWPSVPSGAIVAQITLTDASGRRVTADVSAGEQTKVAGQSPALRTVSRADGTQFFHAAVDLPLGDVPGGIVPSRITLRYLGQEGQLSIAGLSLIDRRTGASVAVTASPDFTLVHNGDTKIYRNASALPRAFIVHAQRLLTAGADPVATMSSKDFDPQREVLLTQPVALGPAPAGKERVDIVEYQAARVVISADVSTTGVLVLLDAFYPGWEATIDGTPSPIIDADCYFRGLVVEPGQHRIEMVFRPQSVKIGGFITLLGVGIVLCVATGGMWARRRGAGRHAAASDAIAQ